MNEEERLREELRWLKQLREGVAEQIAHEEAERLAAEAERARNEKQE